MRYSFYANLDHLLTCIAKLGPTNKTGGLWFLFKREKVYALYFSTLTLLLILEAFAQFGI
jgi:hypothetical protein